MTGDNGAAATGLGGIAPGLATDPADPAAVAALGQRLADAGRLDEARAWLRRALRLDPGRLAIRHRLAWIEMRRGDPALAALLFRDLNAAAPGDAQLCCDTGTINRRLGRLDAAGVWLNRATTLDPRLAPAWFARGVLALLQGDFRTGWALYEARRALAGARAAVRGAAPEWTGGPLAGKRLLVNCDQGFGDAIQYVRLAPVLRQLGAEAVIVGCPPPLARLLADASGVTLTVTRPGAAGVVDAQVPMGSLPALLGLGLSDLPGPIPYLHPAAAEVAVWRRRFADKSGPVVGIAWRGNPAHEDDHNRSIPLSRLAPVLALPGVRFVPIQIDSDVGERARLAACPGVVDPAPSLDDFARTAALVGALDLVIAIDSAVAHLAGALGRPVWVLLPFAPDWRWMLARDDSPWYPSARLFRQPTPGDWDTVIRRVATALAGYT